MVKIGDTVYEFQRERRVYRTDDATGRGTGGPIFAEHFVPGLVVGEEARSWLIETGTVRKYTDKVAKVKFRGEHARWVDADTKDARIWLAENAIAVERAIRHCQSADTLKAIAALLIKAGALDPKAIKG